MAETETPEAKAENMIDPSSDWVMITDPNHVLRKDIDWACLSEHDDWFAIDCSAGETMGMNQRVYHTFRCLRRDHPDYQSGQPQQPLRWVENCKPDKPGMWLRIDNGLISMAVIEDRDLSADQCFHFDSCTRCYLGPLPEILPPVKKVVQRLWVDYCEPNDGKVLFAWFAEGETIQPPGSWVRTDETREVQQ